MSFALRVGVVAAWLLWSAGAMADEPATGRGGVTIGVAPFELVAPSGEVAPDLSLPLVEQLGALGIDRVVGPEALGAAALAAPTPDAVRGWASGSQVAVVVVGRTTRVGSGLNLDLWLRSGQSGEVEGSYVRAIEGPGEIGPALEQLARQIADAAAALLEDSQDGSPDEDNGFDLDEPLQIRSGKLDVSESNGRRRLVFTQNVVATQGDLRVTSDRLVALYPEKLSQPDQLIARGHVVMERGARTATCREATYHRAEGRLVCRGAELREGGDRVKGEVIEFDVTSDRMVVSGGASVSLQLDDQAPREDASDAQDESGVAAQR